MPVAAGPGRVRRYLAETVAQQKAEMLRLGRKGIAELVTAQKEILGEKP